MLWNTVFTWYYFDVLRHFQIAFPQKNAVNLGFCITRLISDQVTHFFLLSKKLFLMAKSFATVKSSILSPSALRWPYP